MYYQDIKLSTPLTIDNPRLVIERSKIVCYTIKLPWKVNRVNKLNLLFHLAQKLTDERLTHMYVCFGILIIYQINIGQNL